MTDRSARTEASFDVFISYAREDLPLARALLEEFERAGLSVWWDDRIVPGEWFDETIADALNECSAVVVLWTPNSVGSRWVRNEATIAAEREVLVPAAVGGVLPPVGFRHVQSAAILLSADGSVHGELMKLMNAVVSTVQRSPDATTPTTPDPTGAAQPGMSFVPRRPSSDRSTFRSRARARWYFIGAGAVLIGAALVWVGVRDTDSSSSMPAGRTADLSWTVACVRLESADDEERCSGVSRPIVPATAGPIDPESCGKVPLEGDFPHWLSPVEGSQWMSMTSSGDLPSYAALAGEARSNKQDEVVPTGWAYEFRSVLDGQDAAGAARLSFSWAADNELTRAEFGGVPLVLDEPPSTLQSQASGISWTCAHRESELVNLDGLPELALIVHTTGDGLSDGLLIWDVQLHDVP